MVTDLQKRIFWVAVGIAAAAEGMLVYRQWPSPPLKVCASAELGELLAATAKADAQRREALNNLRQSPGEEPAKEVMRLEAKSAAAANEVAIYKKQAQARQKAGGAATRDAPCS